MELIAECCRSHKVMWQAMAQDLDFPPHEREVFGLLASLWQLSRYHMPQSREELVTWLLCEASLLHRRIGRARQTPARLKNQKDPVKKLARRATRQHRGKGLSSDKSERSRLRFAA